MQEMDDLLVCFDCDLCVFGKLKSRLPIVDSAEDDFLMACIRRVVILDAFWSRARSTVVNANTPRARERIQMSNDLGFNPPFKEPGPLPSHDHVVYRLAILMVSKSVQSGRDSETHVQWDMIRKFKSTHSNQSRSAKRANQSSLSLADYKGSRISYEECGSIWFQRFTPGC